MRMAWAKWYLDISLSLRCNDLLFLLGMSLTMPWKVPHLHKLTHLPKETSHHFPCSTQMLNSDGGWLTTNWPLNADQGPKGQESKCRQSLDLMFKIYLEVSESQELQLHVASWYSFSRNETPRSSASKVPNQVEIMGALNILIACSIWTLIANVHIWFCLATSSHIQFLEVVRVVYQRWRRSSPFRITYHVYIL